MHMISKTAPTICRFISHRKQH